MGFFFVPMLESFVTILLSQWNVVFVWLLISSYRKEILPWDLTPHVKWGDLYAPSELFLKNSLHHNFGNIWCETWIISREAVGFSADSIWADLKKKLIVVGEKWLGWKEMPGCDGVLKNWCQTEMQWNVMAWLGCWGTGSASSSGSVNTEAEKVTRLFTCLQKLSLYLILVFSFFQKS